MIFLRQTLYPIITPDYKCSDNLSRLSSRSDPVCLLRKLMVTNSLRSDIPGRLRRFLNNNLLPTSQEPDLTWLLEDYNQNCNNSFLVYKCFSKVYTQVYNQVLHLTRTYIDLYPKCISVSITSYLFFSVTVGAVFCTSNLFVCWSPFPIFNVFFK